MKSLKSLFGRIQEREMGGNKFMNEYLDYVEMDMKFKVSVVIPFKLLICLFLILIFVSSAQAAQVKVNGTQYYEKLDGTMTPNPSIITETPSGYRIDWLGMHYFLVWDGVNAYDTFNYPNGTFVSPWVFPRIEYWRTTGSKRWVEVIPLNNTFEQSGNQIIRRMIMGDGSLFNITYTATDKIKYTWVFTAGQNQNYSIVPRMDSAASQDINLTSKRYTPGWFDNRTFYSYGDIQEPYASNVSSWYTSGDRKYFQRIILGQQAIGNRTEIDPSMQFNGSTSPPWQNTTLGNMSIFAENKSIWLYSPAIVNANTKRLYKFDENAGTLVEDSNTTKANGTGVATQWVTSAVLNSGYNTTSSGTLVNSNSILTNSGSISMWFKPNNEINNTHSDLITLYDANYIQCVWITNEGRLTCRVFDTAYRTTVSTIVNFTADTWYWMKYTWTTADTKLYIYNNSDKSYNIYTATAYSGTVGSSANQPIGIGRHRIELKLIFNGTVDEVWHQSVVDSSYPFYSSGNSTHNYSFPDGRQGSTMMVNFTNQSGLYVDAYASADNITYTEVMLNITNATSIAIPASAKAQNQYVRIILKGNTTSTPESMEVTITDEAVAEGGAQGAIPPDPINLAQTNSSTGFWINYTWQNGSGNITNSYNVSVNGTWANGSANNFSNGTVSAHGWRNITTWAFNSSGNGNLSAGSVTLNTQIPNNVPVQQNIGDKSVNENSWLNFSVSSTDADGDALTYATNATKGTLSGYNFSWKPNLVDAGTYYWTFNTTDNYSAVATETITITVNNIDFIPPVPTIGTVTTSNFYINTTWTSGVGNVTNSYNSTNGTVWINGTNPYRNTTLSAHAWQNLTIYAWNSSYGNLSATALTNNTQIPNNAISIGNVSTSYSITEGQTLNIDADYTDADSDIGIFTDNATQWNVNSGTGIVSWLTVDGDQGTYNWNISVTDNNGSTSIANFTVIVSDSTPAVISNLQNTTFNFWINWTWNAGNNADDYDIQINSTDIGYDNTTRIYNATYSAHATRIISIRSHNHTLDSYSAWTNQTTTIPNNAPNLSVSNQTTDEGQQIVIQLNSTDLDGDNLTYSINRTDLFADFNSTTGKGNRTMNYSDSGTIYINAGVSDNYSVIANYTFTITVNNIPLNISSFLPESDPTTTQGAEQRFNVTLNRTANVTWLINGTQVQYNSSVTIANYSNSTAGVGIHNVTANVNESASPDTDYHTWNWTVNSAITYNPPNITSYFNNISGWNQSTVNINAGNSALSNVTVNQTPTTVSFKINGTEEQNTSNLQFNRTFNAIGTFNLTIQANNSNGSSQIVYTVITVVASGGSGTNWDYLTGYVNDDVGTPINLAWVNTSQGDVQTNSTGYFNFSYVFEEGVAYWINGSKQGYQSNNTLLTFNEDHEELNITLSQQYLPNITSWGNSNTSNSSLTFTIQRNTNVTFNITTNQSVTTTWTNGTVSPTKINGTNENVSFAFYNFTTAGTFTVIPYCSNTNGTCTNPPTWNLTVTAPAQESTGSSTTTRSSSISPVDNTEPEEVWNDGRKDYPYTVLFEGSDGRVEFPDSNEHGITALNLFFNTSINTSIKGTYTITVSTYTDYKPRLNGSFKYFSISPTFDLKPTSSIELTSDEAIELYQLYGEKWKKLPKGAKVSKDKHRFPITSFGVFAVKEAGKQEVTANTNPPNEGIFDSVFNFKFKNLEQKDKEAYAMLKVKLAWLVDAVDGLKGLISEKANYLLYKYNGSA